MKFKDLAMYILAGLVVIGFFTTLYMLLYTEIPQENKGSFDLIVGALLGAFSMVVSYFFGSSKGSAEKNELLKPPEK